MRMGILAGLVCLLSHATIRAQDDLDFDRVVAPILASRCLDCHSGSDSKGKLDLSRSSSLKTGGKTGPAVVAGKVSDSLLWHRIADDEMPPKHPLPNREREIIKQWIGQGAKWGTDPIDPYQFTTSARAGKDWWSLQPLLKPTPSSKSENRIDALIAAQLATKKLSPAPSADRRTLIRRIYFDLLGLPPTPEAVYRFVNDPKPDAYERLVSELLASPHYGERWARHWLDVAHFGESDGYEYDNMRPNAWRYRDWVIRAFNDNMPYDQFTKYQIAGDVLAPNDSSAVIATGFLVGGAHDSLLPAGEPLRQVMRQDELEDIVGLVGQSFLGMTVHCARCHDHKFDPIRQTDYYRMASALAGAHRGNRKIAAQAAPKELVERMKRLKTSLTTLDEAAKKTLRIKSPSTQDRLSPPRPFASWDFSKSLKDTIGNLDGTPSQGAIIESGSLVLKGQAYVTTVPLDRNLREKTLEAWVQLDNLEQRGGGVIGVQSPDGAIFDALTFAEREPGKWMAGSDFYQRTQSFHGSTEREARTQWIHVALTYSTDGTITAYRNGKPYGEPYKVEKLATFLKGEGRIVFGIRHSPSGGDKHLAGQIQKANLYDRALTREEVEASAATHGHGVSEKELLTVMSPEDREKRNQMLTELKAAEEQYDAFREFTTFAVIPQQPKITHLLKRGNPQQPGEPISAGGLSFAKDSNFGLPVDASESQRRVALANWIANDHNPLFARTIVNRVWQYHFGRGFIDTPNDLGFSGGPPSHPELLDWLASEFVRSKFNLKELHRLIVTSSTYRQSSEMRNEAAAIDVENRLLWRYSPRRLEAESLRDSMLSVSGLLNPAVGGKGFQDVRPFLFRGSQFYEPLDPIGPEFHRRSIYRMTARGGKNPLLDTFDCPDPSTTTPKRNSTTTPLQALSLMNNSFSLRMADQLAKRLETEFAGNADRQIQRGFTLVYGRDANPAELTASRNVVTEHGLAPFCRALLNTNGFLYVR